MSGDEPAPRFKPSSAAVGHRVAAFIREGDAGQPGSCRAAYDPVTKTLRVQRHDGREEILEDLTPSDIDDIEEIMAGGAPPPPPEESTTSRSVDARREHYGFTALLYLIIEARGTVQLEELVSMIERRRDQHMSLVSNPEERATRYYRFNDEDLGRVAEKFAARLLAAKLPEIAEAPPEPPIAAPAPFDPEFNCPTHFAGGDPKCPACVSKQPKPLISCVCGAEFGAAHEPDCPAAPRMGEASEHYSPPSEVAP